MSGGASPAGRIGLLAVVAGLVAGLLGAVPAGAPAGAADGLHVSVGSVAVAEGTTGANRAVEVRVTLSQPTTAVVTVRVAISPGTATGGGAKPADYKHWPKPKTVTFKAGQTVKSVTVQVFPDAVDEGDETAILTLSDPTGGAGLDIATGTVTILDDDPLSGGPRVWVGSAGVAEGHTGPTRAVPVRVTLNAPAPSTMTVTVGLENATAIGGAGLPSDFKRWGKPKVITFKAGQVSKSVSVVVLPDHYYEDTQTATLRLSAPTGGLVVAAATGTVSILADDDISDASTSGPAVSAACDGALTRVPTGPVSDTALREISGINAGVRNPGIHWVHNDSGDMARVFAIDGNGVTKRAYTLSGASANDWEDIGVGAGPEPGVSYIYVADIGDNGTSRAEVSVYRVAEPAVTAGQAVTLSGVDRLRLKYPDGAKDAEALIVDPETGELLIIQKKGAGGTVGVYHAPGNLAGGSTTTMTKVANLALAAGSTNAVTSAAVSPDGRQIAVRTYGRVLLWGRGTGTIWEALAATPCPGPQPPESQGEAIGFHPDGRAYVTVSEGTNQMLNNYLAP
jgi:hypothetical protein